MAKKERKKHTLTLREEELMQLLWDNKPMYVRELVQLYPDPKPHVNTVSTVVRTLEEKGFVSHEVAGTGYKYFAVAQKDDFADKTLSNVIKGYFNNSYLNAVSTLVEKEKISVDELRELIDLIEKKNG